MWGYNSRNRARPARRMALGVEGLDTKALPGAVGPPLGPYLAAATSLPKVTSLQTIVDPHFAINDFLSNQLGSAVNGVQQQADVQGASENNLVANQVMSQPFIHSVLSRQDTYTLLGQAVYGHRRRVFRSLLGNRPDPGQCAPDRFGPRRSQRASGDSRSRARQRAGSQPQFPQCAYQLVVLCSCIMRSIGRSSRSARRRRISSPKGSPSS